MSTPVQVACTATGLGGSGIHSNGGQQIPHDIAAPVLPLVTPRHPLVPPATGKKRMRPWETVTTSEKTTTPISTREAIPPDSEIPGLIEDDPTIDASAILQSTTCAILGSLEGALERTAAVTAAPPAHFEADSLVLDFRTNIPKLKKRKILILCGGPSDRDVSLYNLFISAGFECVNYDRLNGQQFDLVDDVVKDEILRDIAAGEYVAAFARPECSTFSKHHNFPGPPPLRAVDGPERYGITTNNAEQKEKVRIHTLMAVGVAAALDLLTELRIPWLFETPAIHAGQVSMAHLDEFRALLKMEGVKHTIGMQCPFGA